MNEAMVTQVTTYLDKIGEKLGVGMNNLWPYFVKQQYIEAFWGIFILILGITIVGISIYKCFSYYKIDEEGMKINQVMRDINEVKFWIAVIIGSMGIILILGAAITSISEVPDLFNPEYAAFTDILYRIKR